MVAVLEAVSSAGGASGTSIKHKFSGSSSGASWGQSYNMTLGIVPGCSALGFLTLQEIL